MIRSTLPLAALLGLAATAVGAQTPVQRDPRVRAFAEAYRQFIDSTWVEDGDVVFLIRGTPIHFQDGRLLDGNRPDRRADCDPIFYRYPLAPVTEPPPVAEEFPTSCRDVPEAIWGDTETEIRRHASGLTFLGRRLFVNDVLRGPLGAVEREMRAMAVRDPLVARWIEDIEITYSFFTRDVASTDTPSYHAWGLAFDLVPRSYDGKQAYWRWSRALDREGWQSIPMEERWSPPYAAIEIFERHGFVWGGKWGYFDMIHFEYRPEILYYNRLIEGR